MKSSGTYFCPVCAMDDRKCYFRLRIAVQEDFQVGRRDSRPGGRKGVCGGVQTYSSGAPRTSQNCRLRGKNPLQNEEESCDTLKANIFLVCITQFIPTNIASFASRY